MSNVYCLIVTYNGMQWIDRCLSSVGSSNYPLTTIVFDNGSTDKTCSHIQSNYPTVQLIRSTINFGFGKANNECLRLAASAGAMHFFLLNQDAYIQPDTISALVRQQTANADYGIISPVHLNGDGTALDNNFLSYVRKSAISDWLNATLLNKEKPELITTEFVNAAAWLISAACYQKTGDFNPFFFHYGEDINYCQRALFQGFKLGVCTQSFICHDRDQRPLTASKPEAVRKREWINIANYLCDIREAGVGRMIFKRVLRYFAQFIAALIRFNSVGIRDNAWMMAKIVRSIPDILESRRFSIKL